MAPHGGWIEPYTAELARAIAGDNFSLYTFHGLKEGDNQSLHITSHHFDEPLALEAASGAEWVVAIHGERSGDEAFVMVGGAGAELAGTVAAALRELGIEVAPTRPGLGGLNPLNICNRGMKGAGIQLEISGGLRRRLREEPADLEAFVTCVRGVLQTLEGGRKGEGRDG
jgi:phage replication-related protein YjqB (UPF0714/DUF867 family)